MFSDAMLPYLKLWLLLLSLDRNLITRAKYSLPRYYCLSVKLVTITFSVLATIFLFAALFNTTRGCIVLVELHRVICLLVLFSGVIRNRNEITSLIEKMMTGLDNTGKHLIRRYDAIFPLLVAVNKLLLIGLCFWMGVENDGMQKLCYKFSSNPGKSVAPVLISMWLYGLLIVLVQIMGFVYVAFQLAIKRIANQSIATISRR